MLSPSPAPLPLRRVTERFVLHAGYGCNARCPFCYYIAELEAGTARRLSTEACFRRIGIAARLGKKAVDISGGEPTIRPDLPKLIARCREKGIERVTVITNGFRTADPDYCRSLADAGLTEGLFSLHGFDAASHEAQTKLTGSFDRIVSSVANFHALGLGVRINTVVSPTTLPHLDRFFALARSLDPAIVNLLVFNPAESAELSTTADVARVSDYAVVGEAVSGALDRWKAQFPVVNVRFLPFCFLPRHLDTVKTQWQKFHEDQEWDPLLNVWFQKGATAALAATAVGMLSGWRTPLYRASDASTRVSRSLSAFRMKLFYRKAPACRSCSLDAICTGLPRNFVARFGFPRLEPIRLERPVVDPLAFSGSQREIFASLRNEPTEQTIPEA